MTGATQTAPAVKADPDTVDWGGEEPDDLRGCTDSEEDPDTRRCSSADSGPQASAPAAPASAPASAPPAKAAGTNPRSRSPPPDPLPTRAPSRAQSATPAEPSHRHDALPPLQSAAHADRQGGLPLPPLRVLPDQAREELAVHTLHASPEHQCVQNLLLRELPGDPNWPGDPSTAAG